MLIFARVLCSRSFVRLTGCCSISIISPMFRGSFPWFLCSVVCVCVCFFATEIVFTVIKKKHSMLLFFLFLSFFLCNYHPRGWMSLPWARTAPFYSNVEKRSPFGNMTIDSSIIHFESTRFDLRSFLQMFSRSNGSCLRGSFLRFPSVPRYNFDEKHAWL